MNPVLSIRFRYILGLSILAGLILTTFFVVQNTIASQDNYGRVIRVAGEQSGLTHRIAFFASQMRASADDDDFEVARNQVGRAIHLMQTRHAKLMRGDPGDDFPLITNAFLEMLYHDPTYGLDTATKNFLENARSYYLAPFEERHRHSYAYVYTVNYGPYVLEALQEAAVVEYQGEADRAIDRLKMVELLAVLAALTVIVLEAIFIFRPMERRVQFYVSQLTERQEELAEQRDRAEVATRAKSKFIANVSHELRTPLNAVLGFSEALLHGVYGALANTRQADRLKDIHGSASLLLSLVNDILNLSAADAGKIDLNEEYAVLDDLVVDAIRISEPLARDAGITLIFDRDDGADTALYIDRRRVHQVLINLISNALKFSRRGSEVVIRRVEGPGGRVGFSVADQGYGMTAAEIETALERFGQLHGTGARAAEGTGLGLPVCVELLKAHDAMLALDSEKDIGTTATALFPSDRVREGVASLTSFSKAG